MSKTTTAFELAIQLVDLLESNRELREILSFYGVSVPPKSRELDILNSWSDLPKRIEALERRLTALEGGHTIEDFEYHHTQKGENDA